MDDLALIQDSLDAAERQRGEGLLVKSLREDFRILSDQMKMKQSLLAVDEMARFLRERDDEIGGILKNALEMQNLIDPYRNLIDPYRDQLMRDIQEREAMFKRLDNLQDLKNYLKPELSCDPIFPFQFHAPSVPPMEQSEEEFESEPPKPKVGFHTELGIDHEGKKLPTSNVN